MEFKEAKKSSEKKGKVLKFVKKYGKVAIVAVTLAVGKDLLDMLKK